MKPIDRNIYNHLEKFTPQKRTEVIMEVQYHIQELYGQVIVIKYGGAALTEKKYQQSVLMDIAMLKWAGVKPVIVHGGGPDINEEMSKHDITPQFVDGLRVTDKKVLSITEMVLSGKINKYIVEKLIGLGILAVGISGKDGKTVQVKKKNYSKKDIGFVGDIVSVEPKLLNLLLENNFVPIVSPLGIGKDELTYNINADTVAAHIASAVQAKRVIFLSDVKGILQNDTLLSQLTVQETLELVKKGVITGGMLPKVQAALFCLDNNIAKVHLVSGKEMHAITGELFSHIGTGTMITHKKEKIS